MNKSVWMGAALMLVLSACATRDGSFQPVMLTASDPCDALGPKEHCIIVRIQRNAEGQEVVKVDTVQLKLGSSPRHKIIWKLNPSTPRGYEFPVTGAIIFTNNYGQMYEPTLHVGKRHVSWRDYNTDLIEYFYNITVLDPSGNPITRDPSIVNG